MHTAGVVVVVHASATARNHEAGESVVHLNDVANVTVGDTMVIGEGAGQESGLVIAVTFAANVTASASRLRRDAVGVAGSVSLASALRYNHGVGTAVTFHRTIGSGIGDGSKSGASTAAIAVPVVLVLLLAAVAFIYVTRVRNAKDTDNTAGGSSMPAAFENPMYDEPVQSRNSMA